VVLLLRLGIVGCLFVIFVLALHDFRFFHRSRVGVYGQHSLTRLGVVPVRSASSHTYIDRWTQVSRMNLLVRAAIKANALWIPGTKKDSWDPTRSKSGCDLRASI
jgi:hypothetical protein